MERTNPFEFVGANDLSAEKILDYYIEDYNYSRFIQSSRNVFLIGERGSGKTMMLRYNSFPIQYQKAVLENRECDYRFVAFLISPGPIFDKNEYQLVSDPVKQSKLSEHYLVTSILYSIADTLSHIPVFFKDNEKCKIDFIGKINYLWDIKLQELDENPFEAIKLYADKLLVDTQRFINRYDSDSFYEQCVSFASSVLPLLNYLRLIPVFQESHFIIMIDDAQELNPLQIRMINSWIAYRDHSLFSIKVATVKVDRPEFITATGGTILEGHDYITIDMENPFQNSGSDFYKLAKRIIERRLSKSGFNNINAESFFPISSEFEKELAKCKEEARNIAMTKYGDGASKKQIEDFVYKYHRAIFFRNRSSKANRPSYTGFETIVDVSTGIIRNLLNPCYCMYDNALSSGKPFRSINQKIQNQIILDLSQAQWDMMNNGLNKMIDGCSTEESQHLINLFNQLMVYFSRRLNSNISEPRAIVFSISGKSRSPHKYDYLLRILRYAQKSNYLFTRPYVGKDKGTQSVVYVINRLLFPSRGLDPHGQFAQVSLKADDLWRAAVENRAIPLLEKNKVVLTDPTLFNE